MCGCGKNIGEIGGEHLTEKEYLYFISHVTGVGAVSILNFGNILGVFGQFGQQEKRNSEIPAFSLRRERRHFCNAEKQKVQ